MIRPEKYLGILTRLNEKENEGSTYVTAWVETPNGDTKFFHQNSLINRKEINNIFEGVFILFEIKKTKTKIGEREDAVFCSLNCEPFILKELLQFDIATIKFIFNNATKELKSKLVSKVEMLQDSSFSDEILSKIAFIKNKVNIYLQPTELQNISVEKSKHQSLKILEIAPKSFLETIFETNTTEYNQNLFHILVEGLKTIDNEDTFQQAKFLLKFNNSTTNKNIENLNSIFYYKAITEYKFRLWFEKLTDYCSTDILKTYFDKSELDFKTEIIKRCNGDKNGFLLINNQFKKIEECEEVYFSNIRSKLLQELNNAKKTIFIAVAWFTNDDLFSMLCMKLKQSVKVELIIINDYINNWEFGLPFQAFIDLGGKLYLSEYPNIMHHKFCLIDDDTIFNGSYNWTYYAELRNDENIILFKGKPNLIKEFNFEFERLKLKLKNPTLIFTPFDKFQISRFEKIGFRQYFSTDLTLRAEKIREKDIIHTSKLIDAAIEIDNENSDAKDFQQEINPEVLLQQRSVQVQNIVTENSDTITEELKNDTKNINLIVNQDQVQITNNEVNETKQGENTEIECIPVTNIENEDIKDAPKENFVNNITSIPNINPNLSKQEKKDIVNPQNEEKRIPTKQILTPQIQLTKNNSVKNINTPPIEIKKNSTIIVENYSLPRSELKKYLFKNLQLVFALDYSNSMDNYCDSDGKELGYKLYSTGKIQKVIDMIFAISQGLTSEQNIDMFIFEKKSIRLPQVTQQNYLNYVKQVIEKYPMDATNIFAPIEDIHKTYIDSSKNVFVILITDGENNEEESNQKIIEYFKTNNNTSIFWQFVGLGAKFDFLESLEKIAKNVSFFALNDVQSVSNDKLLERLLLKFPNWYKGIET